MYIPLENFELCYTLYMQTSIIISAHNEEKLIGRCLDSVLNQSRCPNEVIVVAHNCDDGTENIVRGYKDVKLISLQGPEGTIYPRMKAIEQAQYEYIVGIDGDSYAHKDWLKNLVQPLNDPKISAVGGLVLLTGSLYARLISYDFFYFSPIYRTNYRFYFWGANCAFRKSDYEKIGGLTPLLPLKEKMNLRYWAEDLYLSWKLAELGKLVFYPSAVVYSQIPLMTVSQWRKRFDEHDKDRVKFLEYFKLR